MLSSFLKEQQQLVKPWVKAVRTTAISLASECSARPIFPLLPSSSLQLLIFGLPYPFLVLRPLPATASQGKSPVLP